MILRLCPDQIKDYWELVNKTIDVTFPESQMATKSALLKDLMLEVAQCWFHMTDDDINAVIISKINNDYAVGRKTFTVVAFYGVRPINESIMQEAFDTAAKFAKDRDCYFLDFYTTSEKILKYAMGFDIFWRSHYIQMRL